MDAATNAVGKGASTVKVIVSEVPVFSNSSLAYTVTLCNPLQYASIWFYYNPAQYFGTGNFGNLAGDVAVLICVIVGLIIASLFVFRKRDIPV